MTSLQKTVLNAASSASNRHSTVATVVRIPATRDSFQTTLICHLDFGQAPWTCSSPLMMSHRNSQENQKIQLWPLKIVSTLVSDTVSPELLSNCHRLGLNPIMYSLISDQVQLRWGQRMPEEFNCWSKKTGWNYLEVISETCSFHHCIGRPSIDVKWFC